MKNINKQDHEYLFPILVCVFINKQSYAVWLLGTAKYVAMVTGLWLLL